MSYNDGHSGNTHLRRFSKVLFNTFAQNKANNMNSAICILKKRGHINTREEAQKSEAKKIQKNCNRYCEDIF